MLEVFLILSLVGGACSLMGTVLVVRNQSMVADALSHSVLLGIVLAFFISGSLDSPLLVLGAALFGVLTVLGIDLLHSQKITHDAATGLLFSFFFSVAVILISIFARNVHLDLDMVLMGEVLFAPLHRVDFLGVSLPVSLVKATGLFVVNASFFFFAYQPLKLFLFDERGARLAGVPYRFLQLILLFLVSLTTVLSFDAVGSMTVVVFLVAPAMAALPWVKTFAQLLGLSLLFSTIMIGVGYQLALLYDLTLSGTCAVTCLLVVCLSLLIKKGVFSRLLHEK